MTHPCLVLTLNTSESALPFLRAVYTDSLTCTLHISCFVFASFWLLTETACLDPFVTKTTYVSSAVYKINNILCVFLYLRCRLVFLVQTQTNIRITIIVRQLHQTMNVLTLKQCRLYSNCLVFDTWIIKPHKGTTLVVKSFVRTLWQNNGTAEPNDGYIHPLVNPS